MKKPGKPVVVRTTNADNRTAEIKTTANIYFKYFV